MVKIQEYRIPQSLAEADALLHASPKAELIAGGMWLHMTEKRISTAIDLSRLGLDRITSDGSTLSLGAMTTLRQLETDPLTRDNFGGVLSECVKPIVGVQLRNTATVGASVFSKYGFSDLLCALLPLGARVVLYRAGELPLADFLQRKPERDILTQIRIPLSARKAAFVSLRRAATDFAMVNLCVSESSDGKYAVAVGARPGRAIRCPEAEAALARGDLAKAKAAVSALPFGMNIRAGKEYRSAMAAVLLERACDKLKEESK